MSCLPTYKGRRYNSLEELYRLNNAKPLIKKPTKTPVQTEIEFPTGAIKADIEKWKQEELKHLTLDIYAGVAINKNVSLIEYLKERVENEENNVAYSKNIDDTIGYNSSVKHLEQLETALNNAIKVDNEYNSKIQALEQTPVQTEARTFIVSPKDKEHIQDLVDEFRNNDDLTLDKVQEILTDKFINPDLVMKIMDYFDNDIEFNADEIKYQLLQYKDINLETYNNLVSYIEQKLGVSFNKVSLGKSVYGYNKNNELYLNTDMISADTPIHEALGHPVISYIKDNNIELYNNLSNWIKDNFNKGDKNGIVTLYNKVKTASKFNNLKLSEENLIEEVMVNYLSRLLTNKALNTINSDVQEYSNTFDELIQGYINDENLDFKLISSNVNISQLANILFHNQNISRILDTIIKSQKGLQKDNRNIILNDINKKLELFLNNFGFKTEQLDSLKEVTGYNILSATDFLEKMIFVQKDKIDDFYSKEAAYVIFNLLGRKNILRKELIQNIHLFPEYNILYEKYDNGKLPEYVIREYVCIDYLQTKLKIAHLETINLKNEVFSKDVRAKNKLEYYTLKIQRWWSNIIMKYFKSYRQNYIDNIFNQIALDVLNNNTRLFNTNNNRTYSDMTLPDNFKIVHDYLINKGGVVSGSLALNKQGSLSRNTVNDLDFFIPYDLKNNLFEDILKDFPNSKFSKPFAGIYGNKILTMSVLINDVKVDLFLPTSKGESDKNEIVTINDIPYHHWKYIFDAKIKIGSKKHLRDLAGFEPFNKTNYISNINFGGYIENKRNMFNIVGQRHFNFDFIQSKYSKLYDDLTLNNIDGNIKSNTFTINDTEKIEDWLLSNAIDFPNSIQFNDLKLYLKDYKQAIYYYYLTFSENFKYYYGNLDSKNIAKPFVIKKVDEIYSKKSMLLDEKGEPLLFYHGAGTKFDSFNKDYFLSGEGMMAFGAGFYNTNYKPTADNYRDSSRTANDMFHRLLNEKNKELLDLMEEMNIEIDEKYISNLIQNSLSVHGLNDDYNNNNTKLLHLLGITETKAIYIHLSNPIHWKDDMDIENKQLIEKHFNIQLKSLKGGEIYREIQTRLNITDKEVSARLYQIGIDGVIHYTQGGSTVGGFSHKKGEMHVIFFEPVQAKSIVNSGIFSKTNDNIYDPNINDNINNTQLQATVPINTTIKEGVTELFESNPELSSIGTQQLYSQYLDTIFPDSKVKDIVYHTTQAIFDNFDDNKITRKGHFFSFVYNSYRIPDDATHRKFQKEELENQRTIAAVLNIENSNTDYLDINGGIQSVFVNTSNQIHILGSKQDIEGFKEFVNNDNINTTIINNITDNQIKQELQEVYIKQDDNLLQIYLKVNPTANEAFTESQNKLYPNRPLNIMFKNLNNISDEDTRFRC